MPTREEKIETDIIKAEGRYKEAFEAWQFDLAKGIQAQIGTLQEDLKNERQRTATAIQGT